MLKTSRRKVLGAAMVGTGALMTKSGFAHAGRRLQVKGNINLDRIPHVSEGLFDAMSFPLIDALQGRRSRRFALGATIPDGPFEFSSEKDPVPLSEFEQLLLLTAMAGNTGWSNLIPYNGNYSPRIPNYAASAGGRTFPSAAGFHTTELFFTDDHGTYHFPTRDMAAHGHNQNGKLDLRDYLDAHKKRIVKLSDERLGVPRTADHMEVHNHWCANVDGSTLIIPVADLAQHHILSICYLVQNGVCIFDDVNGNPIPGMEKFSSLVDVDNPYPLSYIEQMSLTEVTVEISTACYAGMLMQQAMGLGGWMYGGINPFSVMGASGDENAPGLGFDFEMTKGALLPNITGLEGIFEATCPPNYPTMRDAVEAVIERKYGNGGPFNPKTRGPYKDDKVMRSAAMPSTKEFVDCVTLMTDYTYQTFGRCPGSSSSLFTMMYLQSHNLDTDYYDRYFDAGGYLSTHVDRLRKWQSPA